MGSYSENPSIAYGMISPELVQLFGDNDERMNLFFKPYRQTSESPLFSILPLKDPCEASELPPPAFPPESPGLNWS